MYCPCACYQRSRAGADSAQQRVPFFSQEPNPFAGNCWWPKIIQNRNVIVRLLQEIGLTVDVAQNGHEAVEAASRKSYILVLMDCQMPHMDGYHVVPGLK
jgi:hypothetical protein